MVHIYLLGNCVDSRLKTSFSLTFTIGRAVSGVVCSCIRRGNSHTFMLYYTGCCRVALRVSI